MALTLKDIAAGNKRLGTFSETASYRSGDAPASGNMPASEIQSLIKSENEVKSTNKSLLNSQSKLIANIDKLCAVLEKSIKIGSLGGSANQLSGVKVTPGSSLTENELESQRVTQDMASNIAYLPRIYESMNKLGKSIKDLQKAVEGIETGGDSGLFPFLPDFGSGKSKGKGAAKKTAAKTAAKTGFKSFLKKIPLIGVGAGLIFAADRASKGDTTGAGMELASGAASTFPGPGTAASLGIDAALAAKDMKADDKTPKIETKVETKKYEGTLYNVTRQDIEKHPNFQRYLSQYQKNAKTNYGRDAAYDKAKMRVKSDMILEQNGRDTSMKTPKIEPKKSEGMWSKIKGFFGGNKKNDQQKLSNEIDRENASEDTISAEDIKKYSGGFAEGGTLPPGKIGMVGENGPEIIEGPADITPTTEWLQKNYKSVEDFWSANSQNTGGMGGKKYQDLDMAYAGQEYRRKLANPKYESPKNQNEWQRIQHYLSTPEGRKFQFDQALGTDAQYKALSEGYAKKDKKEAFEPENKVDTNIMSQALYDESRGAVTFGDKGKINEANALALAKNDIGKKLGRKEIDSANRLLSSSSETEMAKNSKGKTGNVNNIVNAPTNVSNTTQKTIIPSEVRNKDTSVNEYYRSRFAS
jgi:hypothetical protein